MFKPHYGQCTHPKHIGYEDSFIVVKKGWCQKCNYQDKQDKKRASGKLTNNIKVRKATGEKDIFEVVLENNGDEPVHCFVCGKRLTFLTHHNYAHVLRKGTYPKFRLNPNNIRIMCYNIDGTGCHTKFDFHPRSELKGPGWEKLFELEELLKQEYRRL
jgi:hypothetical protein